MWAQMVTISRLEAYKMFSNNSTRGVHQAVFGGPRRSYSASQKQILLRRGKQILCYTAVRAYGIE
jgi:hypothetical protein